MAHPKEKNTQPTPKPSGKVERFKVLVDINMGKHRPGDIVEFPESEAFGLLAVGAIQPLPKPPKEKEEAK